MAKFESFTEIELRRTLAEYEQANGSGLFQRKVDELAAEIRRRSSDNRMVTIAIDERFRLIASTPDPVVRGATREETYDLIWAVE
jgi:hypothetical protein